MPAKVYVLVTHIEGVRQYATGKYTFSTKQSDAFKFDDRQYSRCRLGARRWAEKHKLLVQTKLKVQCTIVRLRPKGICQYCRRLPAREGRTCCIHCAAKMNQANKVCQQRRKAQGLCIACNQSHTTGKSKCLVCQFKGRKVLITNHFCSCGASAETALELILHKAGCSTLTNGDDKLAQLTTLSNENDKLAQLAEPILKYFQARPLSKDAQKRIARFEKAKNAPVS